MVSVAQIWRTLQVLRGKKGILIEGLLAVGGAALVGQFLFQSFFASYFASEAITSFTQQYQHPGTPLFSSSLPSPAQPDSLITPSSEPVIPIPTPDQSLWSHTAIEKFSQLPPGKDPIAVISIPGLSLDVPVYAGVSEANLDRGAAWIEYTADPRELGNVGIAGHRDSWFRPLKDIQIGEPLLLKTLEGTEHFVVTEMNIVKPEDTGVLSDTQDKTVTLVTCYPFYFIGSAPERLIISAKLINHSPSGD